jgi:hypothetical protein
LHGWQFALCRFEDCTRVISPQFQKSKSICAVLRLQPSRTVFYL